MSVCVHGWGMKTCSCACSCTSSLHVFFPCLHICVCVCVCLGNVRLHISNSRAVMHISLLSHHPSLTLLFSTSPSMALKSLNVFKSLIGLLNVFIVNSNCVCVCVCVFWGWLWAGVVGNIGAGNLYFPVFINVELAWKVFFRVVFVHTIVSAPLCWCGCVIVVLFFSGYMWDFGSTSVWDR